MQHQKKRKRNAIYIKVLINISNNFTRYILFIIFIKYSEIVLFNSVFDKHNFKYNTHNLKKIQITKVK